MNPGHVSLAHYDGLNGFGSTSAADVDGLMKALEAGYQITNQTGGSALRVESLEESLKVTTWTNKHIKFWKKIPKSPAYSTVEEWNELSAYGTLQGPFTREGELPQTADSTFTRQTSLVKYVGTTREVTHPAAMVHPAHGDLIALENQNGILWLLQLIERFLFIGDAATAFNNAGAAQAESEQFDGLDQMINAASFIDLEGAPIQEADFEEAANTLIEAFAYPTDTFLGTRVNSDLIKTFYPRERINLPAPVGGKVGLSVGSVQTAAGEIELNPDVFITRPDTALAAARGPAALVPTGATIVGVVNALTTGEFVKSQGAVNADYHYRVSVCNRFGESATSAASAAVTMTAANAALGRGIDLTITNAAAVVVPPEYYRVYRTAALAVGAGAPANVALYGLIMQVGAHSQAAATATPQAGVITDTNRIMPLTEIAYMGELTPQVLTFRQLAPMMRMDLAVLAPAYRWMILLYGVPLLFAPLKWLRIINIGRI